LDAISGKDLNFINSWRKFLPFAPILLGVAPFFKYMQRCKVDGKLGCTWNGKANF
jgi:hypothetical protein